MQTITKPNRNKLMKLTERQKEILAYVARSGPVTNGNERSVLEALCKKGLVINHTSPGTSTWTLSEAGKAEV
jgi:hypothetical protein